MENRAEKWISCAHRHCSKQIRKRKTVYSIPKSTWSSLLNRGPKKSWLKHPASALLESAGWRQYQWMIWPEHPRPIRKYQRWRQWSRWTSMSLNLTSRSRRSLTSHGEMLARSLLKMRRMQTEIRIRRSSNSKLWQNRMWEGLNRSFTSTRSLIILQKWAKTSSPRLTIVSINGIWLESSSSSLSSTS